MRSAVQIHFRTWQVQVPGTSYRPHTTPWKLGQCDLISQKYRSHAVCGTSWKLGWDDYGWTRLGTNAVACQFAFDVTGPPKMFSQSCRGSCIPVNLCYWPIRCLCFVRHLSLLSHYRISYVEKVWVRVTRCSQSWTWHVNFIPDEKDAYVWFQNRSMGKHTVGIVQINSE